MLKAGLIGFGGIVKGVHLPAYQALEAAGKVKLVAACDIRPEAFTEDVQLNIDGGDSRFADLHTYTDLEEMLRNEELDFIDIAVPTYLHKKYAVDMLNRGYLVMSEKPMALTYDDCREMAAASNGRLMIGQCLRFCPEYLYLKKLIEDGTYGKVTGGSFRRLSAPPTWGWENWFMDPSRSGGVIFDLHIHDLDIIRFLFGEPKTVSCTAGGHHIVEDAFAVSRMDYDGMSIYAEGRWDQVNMPFVADYRVSFEKANVVLEGGVVTVYPYEGDAFKADITPADMYMKEIEYITDIFVSGQPNLQNPPESAAESIRLAATLKQSADNGGQTLPF
ncbi:MAG: Gfo/Idh/MocA family oxidoreductase [Ruminococcaceae bacterium]|nr:Gfo/Idh/MocA family oxidoreductase [Oscillospiraceae bacterium]